MEVNSLSLISVFLVGSLFFFWVILATAFTKLSIVLMIVRNALGLQAVPSNMIVNTLAIVLAMYISLPVLTGGYNAFREDNTTIRTFDDVIETYNRVTPSFRKFLKTNTDEEKIDFFLGTTEKIWRGSNIRAGRDDLIILVPSFLISELSKAFQIGFLLYLPFIATDFIVTTILMAMGMIMVSPTIISVPFKLLLFVVVGGWSELIEGLILSYQ